MDHLSRLSYNADIFIFISYFLPAEAVTCLGGSSKYFFYAVKRNPLIWKYQLQRSIPNVSNLFRINKNNSYKIIKNWKLNKFSLYSFIPVQKTWISPRYLHRAVNLTESLIMIFGGAQCINDRHLDVYNDVHIVDLAEKSIRKVIPKSGSPCGRCAASMTKFNNTVFVFGGLLINFEFQGDLWAFDAACETWTELRPKPDPACADGQLGAPDGRWGHTMVVFDGVLLIYGGSNPSVVFQDLWALDLTAQHLQWKHVCVGGALPMGRSGHCVTVVGDAMFMFGGNTHGSTLSDLWRFDLARLRSHGLVSCAEVKQQCVPQARIGASLQAVSNKMFLCGGRDKLSQVTPTDVSVLDVRTGQWSRADVNVSCKLHGTGLAGFVTPTGLGYFGGYVGVGTGKGFVNNQFVFLDLFDRSDYCLSASRTSNASDSAAMEC